MARGGKSGWIWLGGAAFVAVSGTVAASAAEEAATRMRDIEAALGAWPVILLGVYSLLIVAASLAGGWMPALLQLSHTRMQILISLVGGLMLGIAVFHMLPHALLQLGPGGVDQAALSMMGGLVTMFFLLRAFHFHHHGETEFTEVCGHIHDHDHQPALTAHQRHAGGEEPHPHRHVHRFSWIGVLVGLGIHTLIDGMALAASLHAEALHGGASRWLGIGTFLAIVLHKPLDAVSITSVMVAGGWSLRARTAVNAAFALMCPLGATVFLLGVQRFSADQSLFAGCALAFSAGVFLCISLSDLLPEMEFHSHNRLPLSLALLAGIILAWGLRFLEPEGPDHHHTPSGVEGNSNDGTSQI